MPSKHQPEKKSPATYMSVSKYLVRVNFNPTSSWISLKGMQRTVPTFLSDFGFTKTSASWKEQFHNALDILGVDEFIVWALSLYTGVEKLIHISKGFKTLNVYEPVESVAEVVRKFGLRSDTANRSKSTWYIRDKYDRQVFQLQVPPSVKRPTSIILRISERFLEAIYKAHRSNERVGISLEVALCNYYHLEHSYSGNRTDYRLVEELCRKWRNSPALLGLPTLTSFVGDERSGRTKSIHDFCAGNKTVSVKSNMGRSSLVCPPISGQPGLAKTLALYSSLLSRRLAFDDIFGESNAGFKNDFVRLIKPICDHHLMNLFSSDYLLHCSVPKGWIRDPSQISFHVIEKPKIRLDSLFKAENFCFSRTPTEWRGSLTIKYKGERLGEAQIHNSANRSRQVKFRFDLMRLEQLLS